MTVSKTARELATEAMVLPSTQHSWADKLKFKSNRRLLKNRIEQAILSYASDKDQKIASLEAELSYLKKDKIVVLESHLASPKSSLAEKERNHHPLCSSVRGLVKAVESIPHPMSENSLHGVLVRWDNLQSALTEVKKEMNL